MVLTAPGDLHLSISVTTDVDLGSLPGSKWVVDARAQGYLVVNGLVAKGVDIVGGGLLRAMAAHVELRDVALSAINITRGSPDKPIYPTDAVILLHPVAGNSSAVGSPEWLAAAQTSIGPRARD